MGCPTVSVIVPSLGRPGALDRCLAGLSQLRYRPYEVVVVACAEGRSAIGRHLNRPWLRVFHNEGEGVAAARNTGLANAGGEIVAFLDDDAVPEPTWLDHLVEAIEDTDADAATGYVLGRNGISFQWRARMIRRDGFIDALAPMGDAPWMPPDNAGAVMLEGTNMALRRDALCRLGGFDRRFRFYMDDADVALRVSDAGLRTVIAPMAQVHHGFEASGRRRADRMPTDLFDIGRSLAIFLARHLHEAAASRALALHRDAERRRLLRAMVRGQCEPRDISRLMDGFERGARAGATAAASHASIDAGAAGEASFRADPKPQMRLLSGGLRAARRLRVEAAEAAVEGDGVSLFLFGPTTLYHRVRFDSAGFWEQTGGVFGRSERSGPLVRAVSFRARVRHEIGRVAKVRGIGDTRH